LEIGDDVERLRYLRGAALPLAFLLRSNAGAWQPLLAGLAAATAVVLLWREI
jgi:hypothetical protein